MSKRRRILLYGRTNAGKTAQIGELAELVKKETGKITRLYTADKGGYDTIQPHIDLGIIDLIEMGDTDPWIFLDKATKGFVRDKDGKWIPGKNSEVGCFAFESLRAFAEALMSSMVDKVAKGVSIGGGANIAFSVAGDGESVKVSGSNMAMFGVAQNAITSAIWASHRLASEYSIWTSSVSKDDDLVSAGKILGPDVIGKALTSEVPRWYDLTFRIDVLPAQHGKPERHILYLGTTVDVGAGNATGLGNLRRPLDAKPIEQVAIEPASIRKALEMVDKGKDEAKEALRKRLNITA